ncbi:MAG: hypothetical protein AB7U83_14215 [Vicinamibacterales bacterium]
MTPPSAHRRVLGEWTLVTVVVAVATVAATWPLAASPWLVPAHQDPLFSSWRLYQWARNLIGDGPGGLFDGNIFTPARDVLLFSDAIPLQALVAAPWLWLGTPVVVVYNALVWASFLTAGLATYACARAISGSRFGALVAAVIFSAAPSRLEHVMHLELLWTAGMPLAVLGGVWILGGDDRGPRLAGLAIAGQFLTCIYYGVFLLVVWPVVVGAEWLRSRTPLSRAMLVRSAGWLAATIAVAALYAVPYQRARAVVGDRPDFEVEYYSAVLPSYASFPPSNLAWGWSAIPDDAERRLAPGVLASGLAVSAVLAATQPWTLALAAGGAVAIDASLGANGWTYLPMRRLLPPFRGLRVPARFGMVALLCVALLAAIAGAHLARQLATWRLAPLAGALVLAGLVAEYASLHPVRAMPPRPPPVYEWLATLPPAIVVHAPLPTPQTLPGPEADFQYFAQYHPHRLLNGNSGFYPPNYIGLLDRSRGFPDVHAVTAMRAAGAEYLLVHAGYFRSPEAFVEVATVLETAPGVMPLTTSEDEAGVVRVYRLEPLD